MKLVDHTVADFEDNARVIRLVIARIEAGLTAFNEAAHADPMAAPLTLAIQAPAAPARAKNRSECLSARLLSP